MNDLESLVLLNMVPSIGSIIAKRLLEVFRKPSDIFSASQEKFCGVEGITPRKIADLQKAPIIFDVAEELQKAQANGISIITMLDREYPEQLKTIYDPPIAIYVKGKLSDCDYNSIAVVGSRRASFYGLSTASRLSAQLAGVGMTVVSGLARGVDTASHRGALAAGGRTIAVLGSGLLRPYPSENEKLADEISRHGAVISEFSLYTPPLARNFPRRNRIISGLSLGVIVVEAARNSGALITAHTALQQSREVFAVPGAMDSITSVGANNLIQQGAKLISGIDDIIDEISIKIRKAVLPAQTHLEKEQPVRPPDLHPCNCRETTIASVLSQQPLHIDEICDRTHMTVSQLSLGLLQLQLRGVIKELPGKNFVRTA